ncbi:unnamed protein product, partial [Iphiclides podalirius]
MVARDETETRAARKRGCAGQEDLGHRPVRAHVAATAESRAAAVCSPREHCTPPPGTDCPARPPPWHHARRATHLYIYNRGPLRKLPRIKTEPSRIKLILSYNL